MPSVTLDIENAVYPYTFDPSQGKLLKLIPPLAAPVYKFASSLTIQTDNLLPGKYDITIISEGGQIERDGTISLHVVNDSVEGIRYVLYDSFSRQLDPIYWLTMINIMVINEAAVDPIEYSLTKLDEIISGFDDPELTFIKYIVSIYDEQIIPLTGALNKVLFTDLLLTSANAEPKTDILSIISVLNEIPYLLDHGEQHQANILITSVRNDVEIWLEKINVFEESSQKEVLIIFLNSLDSLLENDNVPEPKLSTHVVPSEATVGEWVTLSVTATNEGGSATEQGISFAFPDLSSTSGIEVVDSTSFNVGPHWRDPGDTVNSNYATSTVVVSYPLIEAWSAPWAGGESRTFTIRVRPESAGTFRVFVKSIAAVGDDYGYSDPSSGTPDQQNEYRTEYTIIVLPNTESPIPEADGPYNGEEGTPVILDASQSSDPNNDIHYYEWDLDGDGSYEEYTLSIWIAKTWSDDFHGTIYLRVTDQTGLSSIDSTTVTIQNVAPTVNAGSDLTVYENEDITFNGEFTDPGSADTHSIMWNFGEGSVDTGTLTPTHSYTEAGTFTVNLTITDDDGGSSTDQIEITVLQISNQAPNAPSNPSPGDSDNEVSVHTNLSWISSDPDGNDLTHDVYLDTANPPIQNIASDISQTSINPDLDYNTHYYWKVVVSDGVDQTESSIWSFTTVTFESDTPQEDWWNSNWDKKRQVILTENSSNNLRNYPVNITMDTASEIIQGEMNSDCSDIRLINETSMEQLSFSILQPNSVNTIITTKLNLTASTPTSDIFIYYSNTNAQSDTLSFNDAYYEFWDDFEQSNLEDKWGSDNGVDGGYSTFSDGYLQQYAASGQWHWVNIWTLDEFSYTQGWQIDFDFYNDDGNAYARILFGDKNRISQDFTYTEEQCKNILLSSTQHYSSYNQYFTTYNSSGQNIHHHSWDLGEGWYSQKIIYNYNDELIKFWLNGDHKGDFPATNLLSGNTEDWRFGHVLQGGNTGLQPVLDNVKIRAWVELEPTSSLGNELSQGEAYSLTVSVEGSGSTDPSPDTYSYSDGSQVQVDALPDSGWELSHWLLDTVNVGSSDPYTVTMNEDHTLTAVFNETMTSGNWNVSLSVETGTYSALNATFGMKDGATSGFDATAGDLILPPGYSGIESYFYHQNNPSSPVDLRKLYTSLMPIEYPANWTFKVHTFTAITGEINISWETSEVAAIPIDYKINLVTPTEDVNMREASHYTWTADEETTYTFMITLTSEVEHILQLKAGWNMVSLPVIPDDSTANTVMPPGVFFQLVTWSGTGYVTASNFEAARGYWLLVLEDVNVTVFGEPVNSLSLSLSPGWSMVGGPNSIVQSSEAFPGFYQLVTWTGTGYTSATVFDPGKGYWALVLEETQVTLPPE